MNEYRPKSVLIHALRRDSDVQQYGKELNPRHWDRNGKKREQMEKPRKRKKQLKRSKKQPVLNY